MRYLRRFSASQIHFAVCCIIAALVAGLALFEMGRSGMFDPPRIDEPDRPVWRMVPPEKKEVPTIVEIDPEPPPAASPSPAKPDAKPAGKIVEIHRPKPVELIWPYTPRSWRGVKPIEWPED